MTLKELERFVLAEIESYEYEVSDDALGRPFSGEKVKRLLAEMREALVKPEWRVVLIRETPEGPSLASPEHRRCALVADDRNGHELYFDPSEEEFFLADGVGSMGVWGDAVGCFMAQ